MCIKKDNYCIRLHMFMIFFDDVQRVTMFPPASCLF